MAADISAVGCQVADGSEDHQWAKVDPQPHTNSAPSGFTIAFACAVSSLARDPLKTARLIRDNVHSFLMLTEGLPEYLRAFLKRLGSKFWYKPPPKPPHHGLCPRLSFADVDAFSVVATVRHFTVQGSLSANSVRHYRTTTLIGRGCLYRRRRDLAYLIAERADIRLACQTRFKHLSTLDIPSLETFKERLRHSYSTQILATNEFHKVHTNSSIPTFSNARYTPLAPRATIARTTSSPDMKRQRSGTWAASSRVSRMEVWIGFALARAMSGSLVNNYAMNHDRFLNTGAIAHLGHVKRLACHSPAAFERVESQKKQGTRLTIPHTSHYIETF
ncbi:hypothetical protein DE146DRAFT_754501 [Phaeosphaeria sp. MPI-PUGE-AT-0046c]|nr:hypothetical protein DE146DRAFT_754501 [Phaeosphaeria sp. MPI-PUGE-AT-0046c]